MMLPNFQITQTGRITELKQQDYVSRLSTSRKNWLEEDIPEVLQRILDFLQSFDKATVTV